MTGAKQRHGFTLIELLTVAAVFSLLFLIATTVYANVQRFQRGLLTRQRVAADGRYVLEAMARTVRLGSIDYAYYRDPDSNGSFNDEINLSNAVDRLVIRDPFNVVTCYRYRNNAIEVGADCDNTTVITPSDLRVQKFEIRIKPWSDPYLPAPTQASDCKQGTGNFDADVGVCTCSAAADPAPSSSHCFLDQRCLATGTPAPVFVCKNAVTQPQVTITMTTQATNTDPGEQAVITLQTTVVSRTYGQ